LRDRLRDAARDIRNCLNCMEGWQSYTQEFDKKPYYYSRKCECRIAWEKTRGELERKAFEYKRVAKEEYPDLLTPSMLDWSHSAIKEEDIVPIEKIREINNRAEVLAGKWSLPEEMAQERGGASGRN